MSCVPRIALSTLPVKGDNTGAYRQNTTQHNTTQHNTIQYNSKETIQARIQAEHNAALHHRASMTLHDRAENTEGNVIIQVEHNIAHVSITQQDT